MGLIQTVKRWIGMFFKKRAEDDFKVKAIEMPEMDAVISRAANIYNGLPEWLREDDSLRTINFAKSVCSEVARLTTLAIGIQVGGSARADWLQEQIDKVYFHVRHWVEYGCAYGSVIIKPNEKGFDVFTPFDFMITDCDNQGINGVVFKDTYQDDGWYYTRLEYHRFVNITADGKTITPYYVSNRAYRSRSPQSLGDSVSMALTKWSGLLEETPPILKANGEKIDSPMFGLLRMPAANNVDISSPLGLPVFQDALQELRDLDVAYSRNAGEIFDSEKIVLIDDQLMFGSGAPVNKRYAGMSNPKLPHYVKNVFGNGAETFYQEINPQLNTDVRLTGLNALLSQIGYKCGFSNGYFVFNEKTGMVTATQVESDDRRTIQLIKDVRDKLEGCMDDVIYALSLYADLYALAPVGEYEVTYSFGDITYNYEEDKQTWWKYVIQGKVPFWYYLTKFENFSEEDAKALEESAQPKEPRLFAGG